MTILQEIQKWSQGLPAWQQDAIARLYMKPDLSPQDFDDMYALLKSAHGIPDPNDRVPSKLSTEQVAAPQASDRFVQLAAIKNLRNVNALAEDQRLPINPSGLSVIYGENGMTRSSKFEHDSAPGAHLPTPHPNELSAHIEALETWRQICRVSERGDSRQAIMRQPHLYYVPTHNF